MSVCLSTLVCINLVSTLALLICVLGMCWNVVYGKCVNIHDLTMCVHVDVCICIFVCVFLHLSY